MDEIREDAGSTIKVLDEVTRSDRGKSGTGARASWRLWSRKLIKTSKRVGKIAAWLAGGIVTGDALLEILAGLLGG